MAILTAICCIFLTFNTMDILEKYNHKNYWKEDQTYVTFNLIFLGAGWATPDIYFSLISTVILAFINFKIRKKYNVNIRNLFGFLFLFFLALGLISIFGG